MSDDFDGTLDETERAHSNAHRHEYKGGPMNEILPLVMAMAASAAVEGVKPSTRREFSKAERKARKKANRVAKASRKRNRR